MVMIPLERLHGLDLADEIGVALDELLNLVWWDVIFELGEQYVLHYSLCFLHVSCPLYPLSSILYPLSALRSLPD